jgi:hypothetical protein
MEIIASQYQAAIASAPMSLPVKLPGLAVPSLFYSFYIDVCCCREGAVA